MKETFNEKADKFIKEVLGIPPTLEELEANFPHRKGCSQLQTLKQIEKEEFVPIAEASGWAGLPFVRRVNKYLECGECHVQERFSE